MAPACKFLATFLSKTATSAELPERKNIFLVSFRDSQSDIWVTGIHAMLYETVIDVSLSCSAINIILIDLRWRHSFLQRNLWGFFLATSSYPEEWLMFLCLGHTFLVIVFMDLLQLSFELKTFRRCCWWPRDTHHIDRLFITISNMT